MFYEYTFWVVAETGRRVPFAQYLRTGSGPVAYHLSGTEREDRFVREDGARLLRWWRQQARDFPESARLLRSHRPI